MGIITFSVSVFLFSFSIVLFKNKPLSPMALFYGLWSFILFLSLFHFYGIYPPTEEAYFLIFLMLVFFFIGNFIMYFSKATLGKKIRIHKKKRNSGTSIMIKCVLFYCLVGCCIFFTVLDCIVVINALFSKTPVWVIRSWKMAAYGSSNPMLDRRSFFEEVFRTVILEPFGTLIPPVTAYYFFHPRKDKKRFIMLGLSLVYLLLSSFAGGGGRLGYIYYFGCFLLGYLTMSNRKAFPSFKKGKYRKYITVVLIFGVVAVVFFTRFRTGSGNFIKQTYTYFALSPTLLGLWLNDLGEVVHTNGFLTFFGVHSYVFRIFETIGWEHMIPEIYEISYQCMLDAEKFRQVGYGVANAFVTPLYYFFIDGGYPFVCLASTVFGGIVSKFHKGFIGKTEISLRSFAIYVLIMYGVFLTFMRIQTCTPSYVISFAMAYFILDKTDNSNLFPKMEESINVES